MSAVVVRLAECRQILGGVRDPLRAVWDESATMKDRRLLLAMAGASMTDTALWCGRQWCDLKPEVRGNIAGGLRRFSEWAGRLNG